MWLLQKQLALILINWRKLFFCFFFGAAIGWSIPYLLPADYRVSTTLYVGLETYRAYSDYAFSAYANQEYSNQDDYKNWQMSQLSELVLAKDYIEETLEQLMLVDKEWHNLTTTDLRSMLTPEWRTAGRWYLVAYHKDENRAKQAALAWKKVILNKTEQAIKQAQMMIQLDIELQTIRQLEYQAKSRYWENVQALKQIEKNIIILKQENYNSSLSLDKRWQILLPASRVADYSPLWQELLAQQPPQHAFPSAYLAWLQQVELAIKDENPLLLAKREELNREFKLKYSQYLSAVKGSRGLSPNLLVENGALGDETKTTKPRSHADYAIVGGFLGIIFFIVYRLFKAENSSKDKTNENRVF